MLLLCVASCTALTPTGYHLHDRAAAPAASRSPAHKDRRRSTQLLAAAMTSVRASPLATAGVAVPSASLAVAGFCHAMPLLGRWYAAWSLAAPVGCAMVTAAVKGVASDLMAQVGVERCGSRINVMRTLAFASFGAIYLGLYNHWKMNTLYAFLFGHATTTAAVVAKVSARATHARLVYTRPASLAASAFASASLRLTARATR